MFETSVQEAGYVEAGGLRPGLAPVALHPAVGLTAGFMALKVVVTDCPEASIHTWKAKQKVLDTGPYCPAHLPGEKPGGSAS